MEVIFGFGIGIGIGGILISLITRTILRRQPKIIVTKIHVENDDHFLEQNSWTPRDERTEWFNRRAA